MRYIRETQTAGGPHNAVFVVWGSDTSRFVFSNIEITHSETPTQANGGLAWATREKALWKAHNVNSVPEEARATETAIYT